MPARAAASLRSASALGRAWAATKRFMTRALGPIPITPLGVIVSAASAYALIHYGIEQIDLVLLVIGAVGLGLAASGMLATLLGSLLLWRHNRRLDRRASADARSRAKASIDVECGYPAPTGYTLPRLRWLPFISIAWRWIEPEAEVRVVARRGELREEVIASRRGQVGAVVRELEVGDIFGLTQMRLRLREHRKVRFVPSVGQLKRVDVIRGMAGGEDISHPEGPQEGELYDLRAYNPGDPIRFVLWKVFARTRQLVVRAPERALSPIRQTCAYLVAGEGDEPAAGAARLAVELGALGNDWVLGADGSHDDATRKDQAVDILARSAEAGEQAGGKHGGKGLGQFLQRRGHGSVGRAVVFVPGRPGPWIDNVINQCGGVGSRGGRIDFVVGTDGIIPPPKRGWLSRLATRTPAPEVEPGSTAPVTTDEVGEVVRALSNAGRVIVVDRAAGRVYGAGHLASLAGTQTKAA